MASTSLPNAVVSLLTAASYLPGALVLLHSLQELHPKPRKFQTVCLVTPETVDAHTIGVLRNAGYDLVIGVEPIGSGHSGQENLHLMGRPDLDLALTKLHIFRLGSLFSTILYLDADTLPLRPIDHLFDITAPHRFSACPDIGWPDCFNTGVMVIRPGPDDFDGIRDTLRADSNDGRGNGSFDGADQGLLNQYFSDEGPGGQWNRLPFTYNVTPSAAYQYAPAYKHYAHKINLIHFIGPNKPWSNLSSRVAGVGSFGGGATTPTSFDYNSLVDRWYAVYDRYVRGTAAHEPNLAKRFSVPEHHAVWNDPGHVSLPSDRLDLGVLKVAIQQGMAALRPGQYTSLPLEGRVDLIRPKAIPKETPKPFHPWYTSAPAAAVDSHESQPEHGQDRSGSREIHESHQPGPWDLPAYLQPVTASSPPIRDHHDNHKDQHGGDDHPMPPHHGDGQSHNPHHHRHDGQHEHHARGHASEPSQHHHQDHQHHQQQQQEHHHHHEPQQSAWDASRGAPPKHSRPEMSVPMSSHYSPAWDQPVSAHATYFQTHSESAVPQYPSIPRNVHSNDWYSEFTGTTPKQENVKPVFPWESTSVKRPTPGRVFPKPQEPVIPARAAKAKPVKLFLPQIDTSKSVPQPATTQPAPPPLSFAEAMGTYTNAWDNIASIDRYAKRLTVLGIGVERRSHAGLQTAPPSPHPSVTPRHSIRGNPGSGSEGSDGDDEDEEEPQPRYPSNSLYRDKQAQTERPTTADAMVQASPATSPGHSPTFAATTVPVAAGVKPLPISLSAPPVRRRPEGWEGLSGLKAKAPFPVSSYRTTAATAAPSVARPVRPVAQSTGRTWDPKTDLDAVKKGSQLMLNRFVKAGSGDPST